ncbi:helix-turn-helix domain-containing protein [Rhodococcus hoagii]|nr:helix-turn-helix domain-containing protein [Prescottella equi]NKZ70451.1 helix-turn-helix domain-containing protein [Prescottella equi]
MPPTRDTSIRRGLEVLMTLQTRRARESGGLGVTQLAEILDMDKSQVSRSLKVLTEYGMVDRDPKTRAFRLGWRIFNMAQVSGDQRLLECAGGVLDGLLNRLDESVYLSVRSGYDALTVAERTANHSIQAMPAHWSLYSTSVGRVLLTDKTSAEIREMYSGQKLRSARVDGVGSVDDLVEAVTRAREDGHSIVVDEFEVGLAAVGVPVRDYRGVLVASLGVSGPTFRLEPKIDRAVTDLKEAAQELEDLLSLRNGERYPLGREA